MALGPTGIKTMMIDDHGLIVLWHLIELFCDVWLNFFVNNKMNADNLVVFVTLHKIKLGFLYKIV